MTQTQAVKILKARGLESINKKDIQRYTCKSTIDKVALDIVKRSVNIKTKDKI